MPVNLKDLRSIDTLYGEADAWEEIMDFCRKLGMTRSGGSGMDMIKSFIRELYEDTQRYKKVEEIFKVIADGDLPLIKVVRYSENCKHLRKAGDNYGETCFDCNEVFGGTSAKE